MKNEKEIRGLKADAEPREIEAYVQTPEDNDRDNLHNTKKLLEQYRRVRYAVMVSEREMNRQSVEKCGKELSTLVLNAELAGIDLGGTDIAGHARSLVRSKKMLKIVDNALETVRMDPDNGELMYRILYATYFSEKIYPSRDDVIDCLVDSGAAVSRTTYYKYLKAAVSAIDRILWGYTTRDCVEILSHFVSE